MEKKQLRDELMGQESTLREEFQMTDAKYRESELALKELSEKFRTTKSDLEKQRSLLQQEMEFIKQENDSLRSKVTQLKESHEMALQSYQASMNQENQEGMSRRLIEIKNEHASEIERLNHTFESEKKRMNCEFTNLTNQHHELMVKSNAYRIQKDLEEKEFKTVIEELKANITALTNDKNRMETELLDELSMKEDQFYEEKTALMRELDEVKANSQNTIDRITECSQNDIEKIRMMANEEVLNMKKKQREEKEKLDRRHREEVEDNERRHESEKRELEEKYLNSEEQLRTMSHNMQASIDMKDKEIANIRKDLAKSNEDIERLKRDHEEESKKLVT